MRASEIITLLDLTPHPEGGYYRQTWIAENNGRAAGTCIYFLLKAGQVSHWHTVDATEIWHYYTGAPIKLRVAETEAGPVRNLVLGPDLAAGHRPQEIVPTGHWQSATSMGDWTLVGCTVSPGFNFSGFHLADPSFDIPNG